MLCVITGCRSDRPAMVANVGRTVTAVRWVREGEEVEELNGYAVASGWLIAADGLVIQYLEGAIDVLNYSGADPQHLMPLHPPAEEPSLCARQSKLTQV